VLHATSLRIPVVEVEGGTLTALAGFDGHQGIALAVEPRVYAGIDDVLARAVKRGEPAFVLVLDSLEDPQNVGTLLRSAEAAGVHGVIFPTHRQAPLTPAAVKASAGAVEHLLLCPVDDLPGAMSDLRVRGLRIAAAEADAPLTAAQADLRGPLAVVVGSEGQGLSPAIRRRSDIAVRIPMRGAIGSLNAAVAGSILLFAAVAQRDPAGLGDKPARPVAADAWPVRDEPSADAVQRPDAAVDSPGAIAEEAPIPGRTRPKRGQSVVTATATEQSSEPPAEIRTPVRRRTPSKTAAAPEPIEPPAAVATPKGTARRSADTIEEATPVQDPATTTRPVSSPKATRRRAATTKATSPPPDRGDEPSGQELPPGEPDPNWDGRHRRERG
jgi:23S rRNA (guanosine2251-2'-O)-methyltransferase